MTWWYCAVLVYETELVLCPKRIYTFYSETFFVWITSLVTTLHTQIFKCFHKGLNWKFTNVLINKKTVTILPFFFFFIKKLLGMVEMWINEYGDSKTRFSEIEQAHTYFLQGTWKGNGNWKNNNTKAAWALTTHKTSGLKWLKLCAERKRTKSSDMLWKKN